MSSDPAIKCVVWDLDNTLWSGVLLEDERVALRAGIIDVVAGLDGRGILQSVASKNEPGPALDTLREMGLAEYFLHPRIGWGAKSDSIRSIAQSLNLSLDAFALVDDEPYERDEVASELPMVRCFDASAALGLLDLPALQPRFITEDSRRRRALYLADQKRNEAEAQCGAGREAFLAGLGMRVVIARATEADLMRAEELTVRTHQLNTTGTTYSYEELDAFRTSPRHRLLVMELEDRYGTYGKIGLALVECDPSAWTIRLLLMSCRVLTRGVGTIMITHLLRQAKGTGAALRADFVTNDRNRMMYVTYRFAGFAEVCREGDRLLLEHDLASIPEYPPHVAVEAEGEAHHGRA